MVVSFIVPNIVVVLLYITPCFANVQTPAGPFTSRMEKITACDKPTRTYVKDSPIVIHVEIYTTNTSNNTLLKGNFTVKQDVKNVKHKIKGYIWQDNQWRSNFLVNNFDCHSMFVYFMYAGFSVKYDRKNCMFLRGNYSYHDVDINSIQHLYTSKLEYGRVKYKYEMLDPRIGTYYCEMFYLVMLSVNT